MTPRPWSSVQPWFDIIERRVTFPAVLQSTRRLFWLFDGHDYGRACVLPLLDRRSPRVVGRGRVSRQGQVTGAGDTGHRVLGRPPTPHAAADVWSLRDRTRRTHNPCFPAGGLPGVGVSDLPHWPGAVRGSGWTFRRLALWPGLPERFLHDAGHDGNPADGSGAPGFSAVARQRPIQRCQSGPRPVPRRIRPISSRPDVRRHWRVRRPHRRAVGISEPAECTSCGSRPRRGVPVSHCLLPCLRRPILAH